MSLAGLTQAHRVLAPRGKLGIAIFSRPEDSQQTKIMAATGASPVAQWVKPLCLPGVLDSVLEAAGLQPVECGEIPVVLHYPTAEGACRAFMAGGGGARAIQHIGEERVRWAIVQALEGFRMETGEYRIENWFQLVIAE